ncbi:MAG TPA: GNAT family protein [Gemmatimonadaceae bacterium]|jgi:RimJ/RimL family protein N-acetyltransferase|nr:GNAT family protein [Gemmatimonadaceae bacterium]
MNVEPVVLEGDRVRLEPMQRDHLDALLEAGRYEELWRWTRSNATTRETMSAYMDEAFTEAGNGTALPFVTIDKPSQTIVGSTRFANIDHNNRRVEIGWTWISPHFQRTYINSEAKYLMLRHAFDVWDCVRVELKTDVLNEQSRTAMLRLGAIEEGVLRRHVMTYNGRFRDTIYYSILDHEWPAVRARLEARLRRN